MCKDICEFSHLIHMVFMKKSDKNISIYLYTAYLLKRLIAGDQ